MRMLICSLLIATFSFSLTSFANTNNSSTPPSMKFKIAMGTKLCHFVIGAESGYCDDPIFENNKLFDLKPIDVSIAWFAGFDTSMITQGQEFVIDGAYHNYQNESKCEIDFRLFNNTIRGTLFKNHIESAKLKLPCKILEQSQQEIVLEGQGVRLDNERVLSPVVKISK